MQGRALALLALVMASATTTACGEPSVGADASTSRDALGSRGDDASFDGDGVWSRDVRVSPPGASYQDPEAHGTRVVYHDLADDTVRLRELDPRTGLFVEPDSPGLLVDSDVVPFGRANANGPELGADRDGWAVFYVKRVDGGRQIFRATPSVAVGFDVTQLTNGPDHHSLVARRDETRPSTLLAAVEGMTTSSAVVWLDEDAPVIHRVADERERGTAAAFLPESDRMVVGGADAGGIRQLFLVPLDDAGAPAVQLTFDGDDKDNAAAWLPPELGRAAVAVSLNERALAIYVENEAAGWERVATWSGPTSEPRYVRSPEPFVFEGRSYVALGVYDTLDGQGGEIWVYSLASNTAVRCDHGHAPDERVVEPEPFVGESPFIIYSVISADGRWEIWRCTPDP